MCAGRGWSGGGLLSLQLRERVLVGSGRLLRRALLLRVRRRWRGGRWFGFGLEALWRLGCGVDVGEDREIPVAIEV